ncbi:MAG TPA: XdhC/CoxI family protein [Acidobacteriota bacterium]|nr:XdhC/CoxI family protein [Acidobacteriota bacterium]
MTENRELYPDLLEELARLRREGRSVVMATVVATKGSTPRRAGARMLVLRDGSIRGTIGGGVRESEVIERARKLFRKGEAKLIALDFHEEGEGCDGPICGGEMEVFMERIDPVRRIVIAGGGHVGYFLHRFLSLLELKSVVFDERPEQANAERFPGAEIHVEPFDRGLESLKVGPNDGIVIITPEHKHDQVVLKQALATEAGYVGMIGSKKKIKAIFDNLRAEGVPQKQIARCHSPIGLDIGAESPAEIALAIAGEIVAHFRMADGG